MVDHYFDIETSGLNPYEHEILTIQVKQREDIFIWTKWKENNQVNVILKFLNYLRTVRSYESIYGYNT